MGDVQVVTLKDDEVIISKQYLAELEHESLILSKLYSAGVDNWEWYEEALDG